VQTFPYLICLVLIDAVWTYRDYTLIAINFLASLSGQLAQQVRDFAIDSRTDSNFTTTVGYERSLVCLRTITAAVVILTGVSVFNGIIPPLFAPLVIAPLPIMTHRLFGNGGSMSPKVIYLSTMTALLYTGFLLLQSL
jgi:hypothetical protein